MIAAMLGDSTLEYLPPRGGRELGGVRTIPQNTQKNKKGVVYVLYDAFTLDVKSLLNG